MIAAHRLSATGVDEVVHDAATAAKHKLVLLGGGGVWCSWWEPRRSGFFLFQSMRRANYGAVGRATAS